MSEQLEMFPELPQEPARAVSGEVGSQTAETTENASTVILWGGDVLADFARWVIAHALEDCVPDGGEIQDRAQALGLIREVPYDPVKHGGGWSDVVEPGEPWFEFAGRLAGGLK